MATDPRVPDSLSSFVAGWGYPKDEYVKTGNFTPQLYVREGRRMIGEYVMTEHNCRGREVVEDVAGMAAYNMDSHNTQRIVVNGMVKNEGNVEADGFPPYPISYRALVPKRDECTNLLVPVAVSSSHIAFGSIRMEPVFMVLAQSAATAACMAIDEGKSVQDVDVAGLQTRLKEDPYLNGGTKDLLFDEGEEDAVSTTGNWENRFIMHRSYFSSTHFSEDPDAKFSFSFRVPETGKYTVYYYYTRLNDMDMPGESDYSFEITHAGGTQTEYQNAISHKGRWSSLGEWEFNEGEPYKVVASQGKGGQTILADAILLVPEGL